MTRAVVVIPTRHRPGYLDVALASVVPGARAAGVPVVVVDDGPDEEARAVARRHGAELVTMAEPGRGINPARNAGIGPALAHDPAWIALLDDDVAVWDGWLDALLAAADAADDDVGFLCGPIRARFEDHPYRTCGRESPPVTTLDLGPRDVDAPTAYGANFSVRASELARVGRFDEGLVVGGGEEEELLARSGARVRYVARAGVDHRRAGDDARLSSLARARRSRGRAARMGDVERSEAPTLRAELAVLAGCLGHAVRYRCPQGLVMAAHSWGRVEEAWAPTPRPATAGVDDFTSGASGTVAGLRGRLARGEDRLLDLRARRSGKAGGAPGPRRSVLVLAVERPGSDLPEARAELERGHHAVTVRTSGLEGRGKFENLNELLAREDVASYDWVLVLDDDVVLPAGFLDRFLAQAEAGDFALAQPAHRRHSHAAWPHTRRRPGAPARETTFVEIGPVTAFRADAAAALLPFPAVRMGWGLDAHWSAQAAARGWRMGIVDATPVLHRVPVASGYGREEALAEARAFLADRPYVARRDVR